MKHQTSLSTLKIHLLFCFVFLFFCETKARINANLERYSFSSISQEHDLLLPGVHKIVESEDGAMWISSRRGVTRYNGQQTKHYELPPIGKNGLQARSIEVRNFETLGLLAFDSKGNLYKYNKVQDRFDPIYCLNDHREEDVTLNDVFADSQGQIWFATEHGLGMLTADDSLKWLLQGHPISMVGSLGDSLFVGTPEGTLRITPAGEVGDMIAPFASPLCYYFDTQTQHLWLGTFHQGVKIIDTHTWTVVDKPALNAIPDTPVRVFASLNENTLIVGNDGAGLFAVSIDGDEVIPLFLNEGTTPLHGTGIYDVCVDRESNLWISSYMGGIDIAFPAEHLTETVVHADNNPNSLCCNVVNDLLETPDGALWYATEEGISIYRPSAGVWQHTMKGVAVLDLAFTPQGEVLAATYGKGVVVYNMQGKSIRSYNTANGLLDSDYAYCLYIQDDGSLWVGCLDGQLAHLTNGKVEYYPVKVVKYIDSAPNGRLAMCTANGWYELVDNGSGTKELKHYLQERNPESIIHNLSCLYFVSDKELWLGSDGGGVYVIRPGAERAEIISMEQGLPSNVIYGLIPDGQGNMLVTTDEGMAVVDLEKHHVGNLNYLPALHRIFMSGSFCRLQDGRFAFGSTTGAVFVDAEHLSMNPYQTSLVIRRITTNGLSPQQEEEWNQHIYEMLQAGDIQLPAAENSFTLHYESICYANQHDILYQYYLKGYDDGWSESMDRQEVFYSRLPSGHYEFMLRCVSRNDGHEIASLCLPITIAKPWWNTWWAWMCYLLLFVVSACLLWDYFRKEQLRWADNQRISFFVHIAHDLRTPLSLIKAPIEHLNNDPTLSPVGRQYLETINSGSQQLQSLVAQVMDFNKFKIYRKHAPLDPILVKEWLEPKIPRFKQLAEQKQQMLQLDDIADSLTILGDRTVLDSILENLLTNSIKYTPQGGNVTVSVEAGSHKVYIRVIDTGIGIPKSEQKHIFNQYYRASNAVSSRQDGTGLGLSYSYNLAKMQGGKLSFVSKEGEGTTFTLEMKRGEDIHESALNTEDSGTSVVSDDADLSQLPDRNTLLFVDDNEGMRKYIRLTFGSRYQVQTCASAEEALAFLEEHTCDVLVSDVMMPGMHGDELCRRLKEDFSWSWLPVVLLTANDDRESVLAGLAAGADDYILKPFDDAILSSKVEGLLSNRRRMSHYYLEHSIRLAGDAETGSSTISEAHASDDRQEMSESDKRFIEQATQLVLSNLSDGDYNIDNLCQDMCMSRTSFFGRIKALTAQSPQQFVRVIRMEHAASLLRQGHSISEVSFETGFANVKYFSSVFKSYFGIVPSKYS